MTLHVSTTAFLAVAVLAAANPALAATLHQGQDAGISIAVTPTGDPSIGAAAPLPQRLAAKDDQTAKGAPSGGHGPEETVAIPATSDGVLAAVDQRVAALDQVITSGKLGGVHREAFAVRDLLVALPEKVGGLSDAETKTLAAAIGRIRQQAGLLDKFGDAGDAAQTRAVLTRFKTEIAGIRQQVAGKPSRTP